MDNRKNSPDAVSYHSENAERFASAYSNNAAFRERYETWCRLLDRYIAGKKSAIDMGCGSGAFTYYLAGKGLQVTGIDASQRMIEICRRRQKELAADNVRFFTARIPRFEEIPLRPADLIISSSVLEYVDDLTASLAAFRGLLNDDGILVVSLPNAQSLYRRFEKRQFQFLRRPGYYRFVKNLIDARTLESILRPLGMTLLETRYYAHDRMISRLGRALGFPPERTENLFVSVFRKNRN